MRVLFLADRSFAEREPSMLRRLEIGLIAEGLHVVRAAPVETRRVEDELPTGLDALVRYERSPIPFAGQSLARILQRALSSQDALETPSEDGRLIDVIHVWGESLWPDAVELADLTGADIAFECWSRAAMRHIAETERRARRRGGFAARAIWLTPDQALCDEASRVARYWACREACWGVHLPDAERAEWPIPGGGGPIAVSIMSAAGDLASCRNLLTALSQVTRAPGTGGGGGAEALIFLDAGTTEAAPELWRHAESLGLLDRLSTIPDMEGRRSLVLQTHLLINPAAAGEHRTLLLEAMAHGTPIVARADPFNSSIIDGKTAIAAPNGATESWTAALRKLLETPGAPAALGASARAWINDHRLAHRQIAAAIDAYSALRNKGVPPPIPMPAS